jgi:hypothetical protein
MHAESPKKCFPMVINLGASLPSALFPSNHMLQNFAFVFSCWLCLVAIVGMARVYDTAPLQAIGLTVAFGTLAILALARFNRKLHEEMESISTERLMCWHAIRAPVGAAFLVMASEDLLPDLFAKRAGYGDILTALCGVLIVAISPVLGSQKAKSVTYFAWSIIGLADLVIAAGQVFIWH